MEYQKVISFLDNIRNQLSRFKTKNWVKINWDKPRGTHNKDNQIRFETLMLRISLCDYNDAYLLARGTITLRQQLKVKQIMLSIRR